MSPLADHARIVAVETVEMFPYAILDSTFVV